jgi:hypothetical protein
MLGCAYGATAPALERTHPRMTDYRPNGTPAFAPARCTHDDERGRGNAVWVCVVCGHERPKSDADKALAAPAWAFYAENLPAARAAGYDV